MQFYFVTQAVDILYGTLRARGLAYYGTEGIDFILTPRCGIPEEIISSGPTRRHLAQDSMRRKTGVSRRVVF